MNINGRPYQSIWLDKRNDRAVRYINQHLLPFEFRIDTLSSTLEVAEAIRSMRLRGAPLIGAAGAFGIYLACHESDGDSAIDIILEKASLIRNTRPTAVNLARAVDRVVRAIEGKDPGGRVQFAREEALNILDEEKKSSLRIGCHGLPLLDDIYRKKGGGAVNILTHCNAGWLACIDYGTATAPIYMAHDMGMPLHVWVGETRPRNQGARLTAWELGQHGVPHTVITDNSGGHLMQKGMVDLVLVGSDRTTGNGDVANKIGTYLKALAASDNGIPFYVAVPSSSIDFSLTNGLNEIPVEERDAAEVRFVEGWSGEGTERILIMPEGSRVSNYGFDITPARLVTGLITERGICAASARGIGALFPEYHRDN